MRLLAAQYQTMSRKRQVLFYCYNFPLGGVLLSVHDLKNDVAFLLVEEKTIPCPSRKLRYDL